MKVTVEQQEVSLYLGGAFAFVFDSKGQILILREDDKHRKYDWDLPGGKLQNEEPPLDGLYREVKEETGLSIELLDSLCYLKWDRHSSGYPILVAFYLARSISNGLQLSKEHVSFRWVNRDVLRQESIQLPPGQHIVDAIFQHYTNLPYEV